MQFGNHFEFGQRSWGAERMEDYEASLEPEQVKRARLAYTITPKADAGWTRELIDGLMKGAIDVHVHAGPDPGNVRRFDEVDVAIRACAAGMKAIVFKQASAPTAARAPLVQKAVDRWAEDHGVEATRIIGGVALNYAVGGLNLRAVVTSAGYGGKLVWLPVTDTSHHRRVMGLSGGIDVLDASGEVRKELLEILAFIAERDMVLVLSHQSTRERWKVLLEAKRLGVKRILADHPQWCVNKMTIAQMREFADAGVYLGLYWMAAVPNLFNPWVDPQEVLGIIEEVGTDRLVGGTDLMQLGNPDPVEGLRQFMERLLMMGVPLEKVRAIFAENPSTLLFGRAQ